MAMYCMQCSVIGLAPLTVACACGSTRWRGTYELPGEPLERPRPNIAVHGAPGAAMNVVKDSAGNFIVTIVDGSNVLPSKAVQDMLSRRVGQDIVAAGLARRRI